MATNDHVDRVRAIPLWIIAISVAVSVFFVIYAAFAGWAAMIWGKPFGFVRATDTESRPTIGGSSPVTELDRFVLLVGSGTVCSFLEKTAPSLCKARDEKLTVSTIEGSTETGIKLLSDAYLHGRQTPRFPILAMASDRQDEADFICTGNDRFFETHIGEDILRVTFGAKSPDEFRETFNSTAPKLNDCVVTAQGAAAIRIGDLSRWAWKTSSENWNTMPSYRLFVTSEGSATRALFEEHFKRTSRADRICWPGDVTAFDLSFLRALKADQPWITLGSQLLNQDRLPSLQKSGQALQLVVLDENDIPISRGFYIYGRLAGAATRHVEGPSGVAEEGYDVDTRVAHFLVILFRALEESSSALEVDSELLEKQKRFLHLNEGPPASAWISEQAGSDRPIHIYRSH